MPAPIEPHTDGLLPRELRRHRKARGYTQGDLARRMRQLGYDTTQTKISNAELGRYQVSDEDLEVLERILELDGQLWEAKRRDARERVERTVVSALTPAAANLHIRDEPFPGLLHPSGLTTVRPLLTLHRHIGVPSVPTGALGVVLEDAA